MIDKHLNPCVCGDVNPDAETEDGMAATFIECLACGRAVGGIDKADAIAMWNLAMTPRELYKSQ